VERLIGGLDFGEGPRWHEGRLWYSDFYQGAVYAVDEAGGRETILEIDDQPSGLGWLPDGSMLVVSMTRRQVLRVADGVVTIHADLGTVAGFHCNDMVVDARGHAYVGNFGFDLEAGEEPRTAALAHVAPDGTVSVGAEELEFPNGSVITPDGRTLIVGETFAGRYTAFTIGDDGALSDRRIWAEMPGVAPDGCTLDAEGAIWVSDARAPRVLRVAEGGGVLDELPTPQRTFACMLGGADRRTLFVLTAEGAGASVAETGGGAIWTHRVGVPGAGRP